MTFARLLIAAPLVAGCLGPARRGPADAAPPAARAPAAPPPAPAFELMSPDGVSLVPVPDAALPGFEDDGGLRDFAAAARRSIDYYRGLPAGASFAAGGERFTAARMAEALEALLEATELEPRAFRREVARLFKVLRAPGTDGKGNVTFSAYYEHELDAALERGGEYQYPLYGRPADLVERDTARGRTVGRMEGGKLVPYYTRAEIDGGGALEGRGLEIAWAADPLDIFFLQVQGSGWLKLPGGAAPRRVRFAAHNGHPYKSVGNEMLRRGLLTGPGNAREKVVRYMAEHPEERLDLLAVNPRYVFFKLDAGAGAEHAIGSIRQPLTPRRSVAADKAIFPPGALAWMETSDPATRRFVFIQDEGGAIKGPGRVDYFVGAGEEAEDYAVVFWTPGRFDVLVPRDPKP